MPSGAGMAATKEPNCSTRHLPYFHLDRGCTGTQEPGFGRLAAGQRIETVGGRGAAGARKRRAAFRQLSVERSARKVRSGDRDAHGIAHRRPICCVGRFRSVVSQAPSRNPVARW